MSEDDEYQRSYGIHLFWASSVSCVVLAVVNASARIHLWTGVALSALIFAAMYYIVVVRWCQRHPRPLTGSDDLPRRAGPG